MDVVSTFARVQALAQQRAVRISAHAYEELRNDGIRLRDVVLSLPAAQIVEDYPEYFAGPCVLVLQKDRDNRPLHVLWGIQKGQQSPAVLITAYRPTLASWSEDFLKRKKS
jgi:hypothetical protein